MLPAGIRLLTRITAITGIMVAIAHAAADDIRVESVINHTSSGPVPYVVTLGECDDVARLATPDNAGLVMTRDARRGVCEARFSASGAERLSPSVIVHRLDGSTRTLSEQFPSADDAAPQLAYVGLGIDGNDQAQ